MPIITFYSDNETKSSMARKIGVEVIETLENINMKFDVVVGNPPFQDGTRSDQQNKIYNQFSKKAISLSAKHVLFVTPTSVCKKSKRFSLVGLKGLKTVNFAADSYFNEGVNICYWHVDVSNTSISDILVIDSENNSSMFKANTVIYDRNKTDIETANIVGKIRSYTTDMTKRMFSRNNPGPTKSSTMTSEFKYPLLHFNKDGTTKISCYVKRVPYHYNKKKFIVPLSRTFDIKNVIISSDDYDDATVCVDVENQSQIDNIKSFIFSEYFMALVERWKLLDGYGFNEAIKYIHSFDKNKMWTNDEVKLFVESGTN